MFPSILLIFLVVGSFCAILSAVVEKKKKTHALDSGRGPQFLPRMFQTPATWGKVILLSVIAVAVIFLLMMAEKQLDASSPAYGFFMLFVLDVCIPAAMLTVACVILSNPVFWIAGLKTAVLVFFGLSAAFIFYEEIDFAEEILPVVVPVTLISIPVAMLLWLIRNQNIASAILLGVVSLFLEFFIFQGWVFGRFDFLKIGFYDPAVGIAKLVYANALITVAVLSLLPKVRERILSFLIASIPLVVDVVNALNYYLRYNNDTYVSYDHGTYISGEWVGWNAWELNDGLSTILIISISVLLVAGAALIVLSLRTEKKLRKEQLQS